MTGRLSKELRELNPLHRTFESAIRVLCPAKVPTANGGVTYGLVAMRAPPNVFAPSR